MNIPHSKTTRYNKQFRGRNIEDNSQSNKYSKKKTKFQNRLKHSFNNRGQHPTIYGSNASDLSSLQVPSIPEDRQQRPTFTTQQRPRPTPKQTPTFSPQHYGVTFMMFQFITEYIFQLSSALKLQGAEILDGAMDSIMPYSNTNNPNNSSPFIISAQSPLIESLWGLLDCLGFAQARDKNGSRILVFQNRSNDWARIRLARDTIKKAASSNYYTNYYTNYNTYNNNDDNKSQYNCSSDGSSSFALSHYSGAHDNTGYYKKNADKGDNIYSHEGHNHGANSTCYSGYSSSSAGFNDSNSHVSSMEQLVSQKRDIEVYVAHYNKWYLCHYAVKGTNYIGTDGTYTVNHWRNVLMVQITISGKARERSLEIWGKDIRLPVVKNNNNNNNSQ